MAKVNNAPPPTADPSYIGYSKEIDRPINYKTPNKGMASLFEGIGDFVEGAAQVHDTVQKDNINDALQTGVDSIRNEAGVGVATDLASKGQSLFSGDGSQTLPPGASNATDEVGKLTAAYENGQLNDSYYWSRVNALVKQVRTQYPGYRDEIDKSISSIVGTNPANAARSAIQNEFEASRREQASKANRVESFEINKGEFLPPDYYDRKAKGNPYGFEETKQYVATRESNDYAVKSEKARLDLQMTRGNLSGEEAQGSATFEANQLVSTIIGDATRTLSDDLQAKIKAGKPLEAAELQQFQASVAALTAKANVAVNNLLNAPFGNDPSRSYASAIKDKTKLDSIRDNALGNLKATTDLIANGQYGLANMNANMAKAMTDRDVARMLQSSDAARKMKVAAEIAGPAVNAMLTANPGLLGDINTAISNLNLSERIAGEAPNLVGQLDRLKDPKKGGKVDPLAANDLITSTVSTLTDKNMPIQAKVNTAKAAFSPENNAFLTKFSVGDQRKVYQKLLSPDVTNAMIELKKTDPQAFENYAVWASTNFKTVFKAEADTVQKFITGGDGAKVVFNPESNQFAVTVDKEYGKRAREVRGPTDLRAGLDPTKRFNMDHPGLLAALDNVNKNLKALEPIQTEYTGQKPTEALVKEILSIDPKSPKEEGFLQMLWEGIKGMNPISPAGASELPADKQSQAEDDGERIQLAAYTEDDGLDLEGPKGSGGRGGAMGLPGSSNPNRDWSKEPGMHSIGVNKLPAGMRNNNPGNIKYVKGAPGVIGPSENTDQGDPQAQYASPQDGMAAMVRLLNKKYQGGKDTPDKMIAGNMGWTPGNHAAAANVAKTMGIGPHDRLDLSDPQVMKSFTRALILQEHGDAGKRYSDELIEDAIQRVLGAEA